MMNKKEENSFNISKKFKKKVMKKVGKKKKTLTDSIQIQLAIQCLYQDLMERGYLKIHIINNQILKIIC